MEGNGLTDDPTDQELAQPDSFEEVEAFAEEVTETGESIFPRAARLPKGPDSYAKLALLALGIGIMLVLHYMPVEVMPEAAPVGQGTEAVKLTPAGKDAIAVLVLAILLWVSEALPFPVTALLIFLTAPALGVASFREVVELGLGSRVIVFFIGVLLMAAAITHSGVGTRITFFILRHVGTSTRGVIFGFLAVSAFLAMWTTTLGGAAMSTPLALGILQRMRLKPLKSNFGRGLMIACAWGACIGGVATPAGSGPNPLAIGYLAESAGIEISFLDWMKYGVPAMLLMLPVGWYILIKVFPPEVDRLPVTVEQIEREVKQLGPWSLREVYTCIVFGITVSLWVLTPLIRSLTEGRVSLSTHSVALLGGVLLFLPKGAVFRWKDVQKEIDWGGVVLIAGALCIGRLLDKTGAADWLARILLGKLSVVPPLLRVPAVILAVHVLHLAFASNTVTGTVIIPLLVALSKDLNINPWIICGPAAFTCSQAFILVTETPTNVIPYSTGYFKIGDMAKAGIVMTLAATICLSIVMVLIGAMTGRPAF